MLALDIGTRTVVGLLCRLDESGQVVVEYHQVEWHPQRAMLDGQIHDVAQVSAVLTKVKEALAERAGITIEGAAIAAAGRALTTSRITEKLEFDSLKEVGSEELQQLEMKTLATARETMAKQTTTLYCVGFSPINYYLDDTVINNPLGQRGHSIGMKIIATFLPRVVVDSLFSALAKAGLKVESMTLEPIAAIAVAVPPPLRLLNLALVDIGAGTSDIAISREGTIVSFGMVDMAGDEVTEAIAQQYLLDFNSAEKVKIQIGTQEKIKFTDVLGNHCQEDRDSILAVIEPAVTRLAKELAAAISHNNGGTSPAAVFCVGGGSLTPMLREALAENLGLPLARVGIRTKEHLEGIRFSSDELKGPEIVTPLGIALTAVKPRGEHFIRILLNGQDVSLFNLQNATVAQALIHSGLDMDAMAGSSAILVFELNGQAREIPGKPGKAGVVTVNSITATLDTQLETGDRVEVTPGEKGPNPLVTLTELAAEFPLPQYSINGAPLEIPLVQKINKLPAQLDSPIRPGDKVEIRPPSTVGELATLMDIDCSRMKVVVDGAETKYTTPLPPKAVIEILPVGQQQISEEPSLKRAAISVTVNGVTMDMPPERSMLAYALSQADIKHMGEDRGDLVITVNGREAEYTTLLNSGDKVEVFWAPRDSGEALQ